MDIARIDLFLKSQDYNASLAKATSKLKTCENTTRGLDTRVRALEQATDFWLDEVKRLRTRLHDDTGFENWDLDRVGYLAAYRPHIDVCYESIKLNQSQKALQELRAKQKAFADRQVDLTEALNVRREHVAQRQKTREAHLKNCIEKVEKLKRELARVVPLCD